jgi:hypothetical protein
MLRVKIFIDGAGFKDSLSGRCRCGAYLFPRLKRTGMGAGNNLRQVERDSRMSDNKKIFFIDFSFSSKMSSNVIN